MSNEHSDEIIEILKNHIADGIKPEQVTPEALLDDLGIDSVGRLEIIFDIEEAFNIEIPTDQEESGIDTAFVSVEDIIKAANTLINKKS